MVNIRIYLDNKTQYTPDVQRASLEYLFKHALRLYKFKMVHSDDFMAEQQGVRFRAVLKEHLEVISSYLTKDGIEHEALSLVAWDDEVEMSIGFFPCNKSIKPDYKLTNNAAFYTQTRKVNKYGMAVILRKKANELQIA